MKPLTVFEAEAEARFRWGNLFVRGFARYTSGLRKPFEVGSKQFGSVKIRGRGASWEGAFSNADTLTNDERPGKSLNPGARSNPGGARPRRLP
jgi:hypothetical protein